MLEGHRSGRPLTLSEDQLIELGDIIDSGPIAYGFTTAIWTSIMIREIIQNEFSVEYHPGHIRKLLHKLNFSVQKPKRVLARADEEEKNRWRRYIYPIPKPNKDDKVSVSKVVDVHVKRLEEQMGVMSLSGRPRTAVGPQVDHTTAYALFGDSFKSDTDSEDESYSPGSSPGSQSKKSNR